MKKEGIGHPSTANLVDVNNEEDFVFVGKIKKDVEDCGVDSSEDMYKCSVSETLQE